jgi:hypothetical protein
MYLKQLLEPLGDPCTAPIPLHADNQTSILIAENEKSTAATRHIALADLYIKELAEQKHIKLHFTPSEHNTADGFTKPLAAPAFQAFKNQLRIIATAVDGGVLETTQ